MHIVDKGYCAWVIEGMGISVVGEGKGEDTRVVHKSGVESETISKSERDNGNHIPNYMGRHRHGNGRGH